MSYQYWSHYQDTTGNVWEIVEDCWHADYTDAPTDASAWKETGGADCSFRMIRGGSWSEDPVRMRSSQRSWTERERDIQTSGFDWSRT
jgi:formylglycine-generating enzyme required for sulfatase activity